MIGAQRRVHLRLWWLLGPVLIGLVLYAAMTRDSPPPEAARPEALP